MLVLFDDTEPPRLPRDRAENGPKGVMGLLELQASTLAASSRLVPMIGPEIWMGGGGASWQNDLMLRRRRDRCMARYWRSLEARKRSSAPRTMPGKKPTRTALIGNSGPTAQLGAVAVSDDEKEDDGEDGMGMTASGEDGDDVDEGDAGAEALVL